MAPELAPASRVIAQLKELLGLGTQDLSLETLERLTRRQLLEWADRLGLTGVQRLTKGALAGRLESALRHLGVASAPPEPSEPAGDSHKFEVGRRRGDDRPPEQIPWGYGRDRVTAMAIDPDRLFVYWEATDDAIARARNGLGAGGDGAWLDLRVYDVTGRLFDGTNAHGYFDHKVERNDRQWFFDIGRPTSTVCVELGMRSHEGYFVRIVRSGRVDFPRRDPSPSGEVEWLTVRTGGSDAGPVVPGAGPVEVPPGAPAPESRESGGENERHDTHAPEEWVPAGVWAEGHEAIAWTSPAVHSTWEAGPFEHPVEVPPTVTERYEGELAVSARDGKTWVVYGPWEVRIRGLDSRVERRVVARWEVWCSWVADVRDAVVTRRNGVAVPATGATGASERWLVGSERWLAGSELRLRGASEAWMAGASELRLRGASEAFAAGASERRLRGASEWRWTGGSAGRYAGASEHLGASERMLPLPPKR
jgi:hypothetical protein